jgi:hypothetical protein
MRGISSLKTCNEGQKKRAKVCKDNHGQERRRRDIHRLLVDWDGASNQQGNISGKKVNSVFVKVKDERSLTGQEM